MLVEVNDRIFPGVAVPKVPDHGLHVGLVEQLHYFGDAHLVEVDTRADGFASASARAQEGLHQLAKERVRAHVGGEVVGGAPGGVCDPGREQAVGDGLGIHVGETGLIQVMDERSLECLHELGEGPGFALDVQRCSDAVAGPASQLRQAPG